MALPIETDDREFLVCYLQEHPIDPKFDYVDELLDVDTKEEFEQQMARTAKQFLDEAGIQSPAI